MTTIRKPLPTPLEAEYKEKIKLFEKKTRSAKTAQAVGTQKLPEDVVSLSSEVSTPDEPLANMAPSQPVTISEKQLLKNLFSTYA